MEHINTDSCIGDGEEQGVRSGVETPVPISSQAHDAGPHQEVQLAPEPSNAE